MKRAYTQGFTLVELIVVIVILGVLVALGGTFIVQPMQGYLDQSRRAELTDAAEMALQRMTRDVRAALPNSVRTDGVALEIINVKDAARYRAGPGQAPVGGSADRRLQFNQADTSFNVMGPRIPAIAGSDRLVIFNLGPGQPGGDAYQGDAVITPDSVTPAVSDDGDVPGEWRVDLSSGHQFALESPSQRLYVVDNAVAYVCAGDSLYRVTRAIQPGLPVDASGGSQVVSGVTSCGFSYDPGTATRNAVVTMELAVARGGETVRLIRQVHVENAP